MSVPSDRIWHRHNFFYADLPMRSDPVVLTSDRKFSENSCREDQKDAKQDERDSWQATLDQLYIYTIIKYQGLAFHSCVACLQKAQAL